MRLRWTVVDVAGGVPGTADVVVTCPRGTRLEEVLPLLPGTRDGGSAGAARAVGPTWVGGATVGAGAAVGSPPLLDGAVLTLGAPAHPATTTTTALLELVVSSGPDAGTVVPLARGRLSVGRSHACDVALLDPRLSRTHCTLTVSASGVQVTDAGSTNGTDVTAGPMTVRLGQEWRAGAGRFRLRAASRRPGVPVAVDDRGDGTREVRPPPRARMPEDAPELRLPPPARSRRAGTFPLLAVLLPAAAAGCLAWWTGSVVYLFLAALGPLLVAGSWWTGRREARREGLLGRREHARASAEVRARAQDAAEGLARARRVAMPAAPTLLEDTVHVCGHLWERHHRDPDAMRVRLGYALAPRPGGALPGAPLLPRVRVLDPDGTAEPVMTGADLLSVDLRDGPLGVVEPSDDPSCARFLVGQLVALLPPSSLSVVPVVGTRSLRSWDWLWLLPHVEGGASGTGRATAPLSAPVSSHQVLRSVEAAAARRADRGAGARGAAPQDDASPAVLVVVDDPDGEVDDADLQRLTGARGEGVHLLVVGRSTAALPRGCAAVLAPISHDGVDGALTRLHDGARAWATLDRVAPWWSSRLARALAPLRARATGTDGAMPATVRLEDLLDVGAAATARRWLDPPDGLAVPLGVGRQGPVVVDLTTAGPHALVAGTTGAGKSELLRSWLLSMAATQPPDRLALLLVDYKGGATFDDLVGLPHCIGLLTDLDGGATARVLHSLRAEVRRRERLLAAAGVRDLLEYRRTAQVAWQPVPRLLVVVDEFRVLADEAPDVLGQFVRLAATGRSLGVHLVLATQRPGGVVSTDIRANAGLRIALRVQDGAESRDVVDRPDAAWLPPTAPGRAVVVGAGVDTTLQTAWVGGSDDGQLVTVLPVAGGAPRSSAPPPPRQSQRSQQQPRQPRRPGAASVAGGPAGVVASILEAASRSGAGTARSPWLPPLPPRVTDVGELLDLGAPHPDVPAAGLTLGVADLPWAQARCRLVWRPVDDGPLLVLGAARSGRTSSLEVAAAAAAGTGVPVVRLSGSSGQEDHVVDTLAGLLCAPARWGPSAPASTPEGRAECRLLLLVDDVDELLDPGADTTAADLLLRLARAGHRDGIGVAMAGGRVLAGSRLAATARTRLVHRTVDRSDALLAGVPRAVGPLVPVPGRCHAVGFESLLQQDLGHGTHDHPPGEAGGPGAVEVQVLELRHQAPRTGGAPSDSSPPWLPRPLPARLSVTDLPRPTTTTLPVGTTTTGEAWLLDLTPGGLLVVAGPSGSGRSTVLATLEWQARVAGLVVHRRLPSDDGGETLDRADLVLLDDVHRRSDPDLLAVERWVTAVPGSATGDDAPRTTLVVAGSTAWFADGFRGLPALARHAGRGVVLSPGRTDLRDVLGVRGGLLQLERRPGRGLLVDRGQVRRVHAATPPQEPLPESVSPVGPVGRSSATRPAGSRATDLS